MPGIDADARAVLSAAMTLLQLAFLLAAQQASASPFNGVWLMELGPGSMEAKPQRLSVEKGVFSRGEAGSDLSVRADGAFHAVPDEDYVDAVAATATGRRRLRELDRFKGKLVYSVDYAVSADGDTMTSSVVDYSKPDGKPIPTRMTYRRVGRAARGGSLVSGQWRAIGVKTTREHLTDHFTLQGDRFSTNGPGGYGFDAVVGGPPVPIRGDATDGRAAITMPDARTIIQQLSLRGKLMAVVTMTLVDDQTIAVKARREAGGSVTSWTLHRQ